MNILIKSANIIYLLVEIIIIGVCDNSYGNKNVYNLKRPTGRILKLLTKRM